jgi:hypothetical protein
VAAQDVKPKKRRPFSFFHTRGSSTDPSQSDAQPVRQTTPNPVFWPEHYLKEDIPNARIYTYGYNADVIGGMFEANNQNNILQHAQNLSAQFERDIENEVCFVYFVS